MLCILAVFIPAFFMTGAARSLFAPLSLASHLLSSTFVPVVSIWALGTASAQDHPREPFFYRLHHRYDGLGKKSPMRMLPDGLIMLPEPSVVGAQLVRIGMNDDGALTGAKWRRCREGP
jgi:multidrug efflux pump subunit AcrB